MKKCMLLLSCLFSFAAIQAQTVSSTDLQQLTGTWKGELTYLDYTSNKEESINASLEVMKKNAGSFSFNYMFPGETGHNGTDNFEINRAGRYINNMKVIEVSRPAGQGLRLVLEEQGTDGNDNRPATFHHVLQAAPGKLTITKLVKFDGTGSFFQRNQFAFFR